MGERQCTVAHTKHERGSSEIEGGRKRRAMVPGQAGTVWKGKERKAKEAWYRDKRVLYGEDDGEARHAVGHHHLSHNTTPPHTTAVRENVSVS